MRRLGVNIDHVATLRQARRSPYPDPVQAALVAETAGAQQITCHIRCDRRHVNERDIRILAQVVTTQLNVECAATDEMIGIMLELRPHRVTLVPETAEEVTTEGGLLLTRDSVLAEITAATTALAEAGILVSLFIDPDLDVIALSTIPGVDQLELNTAAYAECPSHLRGPELARLAAAANAVEAAGLVVAAGHGLTHTNLADLVAAAPNIEEYNIGHSIVSRSVFVGLDRAITDLLALL